MSLPPAGASGLPALDVVAARAWISAVAAAVADRADELTALDAAIGDGDHGVNLNRGFTAVLAALEATPPQTVAEVFTRTGNTLVSRVGGASGPLYGSAFRALGKALPATSSVDAVAFGAGLRAGLDAVRKLGGAAPGDKTMVDAYEPAVAAFEKASGESFEAAARAAATAALDGVESTVDLQARKGRASYLGERSIGHPDPGATSTALLFTTLTEAVAS